MFYYICSLYFLAVKIPFLECYKSSFFLFITSLFISALSYSRALKLVNSLTFIDISSTFIAECFTLFISEGFLLIGFIYYTPFEDEMLDFLGSSPLFFGAFGIFGTFSF